MSVARNPITERDLRQHFNAPPTVDVGNHLRELSRVFIPALVGAIIVAVAMYLVAASGPDRYEVAITAKIDSAVVTNMTDVTVNMLAPPFMALSQSKAVLDDIRQTTGTSMSSDELAKNLVVTVQTSPALVQISVTAATPEEATALADAAVTSLDKAGMDLWNDKVKKDLIDLQNSASVAADEIALLPDPSPFRDVLKADYDAQVQRASQLQAMMPTRLGLLAAPETAVKVAPKPVQQALVVGLLSLIVFLELLTFLNGRFGRRTNAAWVRRMARKHGYGVENSAADAQGWPQATQIVLNKTLDLESDPLVLYPRSSSAAKQFVDGVSRDAGRSALTYPVPSNWWSDGTNVGIPLAIVVVDLKDSSRKALAASFDALDGYEAPVQLVTIRPKRAKGSKRSGGKHHALLHPFGKSEGNPKDDPAMSHPVEGAVDSVYVQARH